jgi:hypothetical protein
VQRELSGMCLDVSNGLEEAKNGQMNHLRQQPSFLFPASLFSSVVRAES